MGLELVENSAGGAVGTVGQFRTLQRYVLTMLARGEGFVSDGQSHQEIGDLAIFLAPFGIQLRSGRRGLEARVRIDPNSMQGGFPPGHVQVSSRRNSASEQRELVVLPLQEEPA